MASRKGPFVTRRGDKVTIDLSKARELVNVGEGIACVLAEDALRLAKRSEQYLQGVVSRAKASAQTKKRPDTRRQSDFPDGPPTFADTKAFKNDGS